MTSKPVSATAAGPSAVSATAKGATVLILIQVLSRALTFVINQILLRYLSPALLGASTQLELYCISVLYFARESIRVALQRQTGDAQAVVNVSYISIVAGLPLAWGLGALYVSSSSLPQDIPYAKATVFLYGLAAMGELFIEPCFVFVQQKLAYKVRAAAEMLASIVRCVATVGVVVWAHRSGRDFGVLPFGIGQLAFAYTLVLVYYIRTAPIAYAAGTSLLPPRPLSTTAENGEGYILGFFPHSVLSLAANLTLQSSIKYVLTHGASLLVAALTPLSEQGAYALAANYGGLAARMLFQPLEETGRNLFGKLCAPESNLKPTDTATTTNGERAASEKQSTKTSASSRITQAATTLNVILRFYCLIGLAAWCIGPSVAPALLRLIAGQKWADTGAGEVLATYCYYIPLLAVNGITEAFVSAVATNAELKRQSALMALWFAAFVAAAFVLLRVLNLGARGLVLADCLNMSLRIIWNVDFIKNFFRRHGESFSLRSALPRLQSICSAVAVAAMAEHVRRRGMVSKGLLQELMSMGLYGTLFAVPVLAWERAFFLDCYRLIKKQP